MIIDETQTLLSSAWNKLVTIIRKQWKSQWINAIFFNSLIAIKQDYWLTCGKQDGLICFTSSNIALKYSTSRNPKKPDTYGWVILTCEKWANTLCKIESG